MIDACNFLKRLKHWLPSCLIKRTQKKENCERFLRHHHQLQPQRKIAEKTLTITVAQHATIKNCAIFSFLRIKYRLDRSHLLEKALIEKEYGRQKNSKVSQVNESCIDCYFQVD